MLQLILIIIITNVIFSLICNLHTGVHTLQRQPYSKFSQISSIQSTLAKSHFYHSWTLVQHLTQWITKFCFKSYHHPLAFRLLYIIGFHRISPAELNMSTTLISVLSRVMSCMEFRKGQCLALFFLCSTPPRSEKSSKRTT